MPQRSKTLQEACRCSSFWGLSDSRNGNSLDKTEDDFVDAYHQWRKKCPNGAKPGHAAFCQRCDNSYPSKIGGADFLRKQGVVVTNPFEKFPEPLKPREGPKVSPPLWENLGSFIQRVPLAPKNTGAKIEELTEVTAQEQDLMADNEKTRALFRELLGMTDGANAGGRGTMHIPDDMIDAMAGDAAQEELARNSLIMEMREREDRRRGAEFVSLDLMEMEANDVDSFIAKARKKIIKRSKSTRKGCCMKIGGVLDQMLGSAGGEYADETQAKDRGKSDPIGESDETYTKVTESNSVDIDLLKFIAEEFEYWEHDLDCRFADPKFSLDENAQRFFQAPKRHGLLREYFNLVDGDEIPAEKSRAALDTLKQKLAEDRLTGKESALMPRLTTFVKLGGGEVDNQQQEEDVTMQPSQTASALSGFMESSGAVNRYKAADAGSGKGSPDSGQASYSQPVGQPGLKTRPDNADYPTELAPVKGGGNASKTSGQPQSLSTRGKDRGDPIGEGAESDEDAPQISETASALSGFMESSHTAKEARLALYGGDAGELSTKDRPKERLGLPLNPAKGAYPKSDEKPRFEKGADPRGDAHDKGAGKN